LLLLLVLRSLEIVATVVGSSESRGIILYSRYCCVIIGVGLDFVTIIE
jgi:hypothetical protein